MTNETLALLVGLFAGTFASEDAACVGAGLLVAAGKLAFWPAAVACLLGIFCSDLALVAVGRVAAARTAAGRSLPGWVRWLLPPAPARERAERWFAVHGIWVVLLSRFVPGTRAATCVAAGLLRAPLRRFLPVFLLAAALWTPLVVWLVARVGAEAAETLQVGVARAAVFVLVVVAVMVVLVRVAAAASTADGRRRLRVRWHRAVHFEFWPFWVLYLPVWVYMAVWLWPRHGKLGTFAAANPSIPFGGLRGESKSLILGGLAGAGEAVAAWALVPAGLLHAERLGIVERFAAGCWPVVLKPDIGERGRSVAIIRGREEAAAWLAESSPAAVVQRYIGGLEYGVLYERAPWEERGRVTSLTGKEFPSVDGDGKRTLRDLILAHPRAVLMGDHFVAVHWQRLGEVPAEGERVPLADIGNHCRGTVFLDARADITPELEAAIDRIARHFEGFHIGRFDLRVPSVDDLRAGRNLSVLELNGVASEPGHIYDPTRVSLAAALWALCRHWTVAFRFGAEMRRRGVAAPGFWQMYRLVWGADIATAVSGAGRNAAPTGVA